jgi:hypothetical protein
MRTGVLPLREALIEGTKQPSRKCATAVNPKWHGD